DIFIGQTDPLKIEFVYWLTWGLRLTSR
ncbi:MAG: hypothetical protein K0R88_2907, partial [Solirubrobacterales bacterium]|nr:hypothetical protein [Solirubrobacterales bacterium]